MTADHGTADVSTDLAAIAGDIDDLRTQHRRALGILLVRRAEIVARAVEQGLATRVIAGRLGCTHTCVARIRASR